MTSTIADMFRKSPFEPMRYHMNAVTECIKLVHPMFCAVRDGCHDELQELADKVFKLEHEADIIKDEIRRTIPTRFFLPVYRGDLLGYLKLQDDMADAVEDIAALLTIKKLSLAPTLVDTTFEFIAKVEEVCRKIHAVGDYIPTLVEGQMVGPNADHALELVADVEKTEWEADRISYKLSRELFAIDDEIKPSDLLLWFRIFGELGHLADFAEKNADRLRRMLAS
jgi:uncharacterized protein